MKNLKLLYSKVITSDLLLDAKALCADEDSGKVYFASSCHLYSLTEKTKEVSSQLLKFDRLEDGIEERCTTEAIIIAMEYLIETQSVFMAFKNGEILVYSTIEKIMDSVGSVSSGISAASWSSDQELLVILTCVGNFMLMTKEFDVLMEQDMQPSKFGECSPITVGWGSKETQFHGSEGKQAAKIKAAVPHPALAWDDKQPRISWRGDGDFFVTSAIDQNLGCRKLRIWSREGTLCYTSENKDGLEHPLCWRPSGELITCTQQHPNKHDVIFFEKNGLHHGGFTLPFPPNSFLVKEVLWNMTSSLLAVWGHEMSDPLHFRITIWTVSNYHWYMKQNLDFNCAVKHVSWDTSRTCMLHVLTSGGHYYQYNWTSVYSRSHGTTDNDNVSIAVIDNKDIRITPFRRTIVPPPMCSYSFTCPSSINHIIFSPCPSSEDFCVVLSNNQILRFSKEPCGDNNGSLPEGLKGTLQAIGGNGFKAVLEPHFFAGTYSISCQEPSFLCYPNSVYNFAWIAPNKLLCVSSSAAQTALLLSAELPQPDSNPEVKKLNLICHGEIEETIIGIAANENGTMTAIQLAGGKIMKFQDNILLPWFDEVKHLCMPTPCTRFSVHEVNGKDFVLGLSNNFCLYGNDNTLITNCTSYCCHGDFLVITSCNSHLKCYSISAVLDACEKKSSTLKELASQPVEKGARIVASVPTGTMVILQAPRGNLEIIHPRPLILSAISKHLNNLQYKIAFDLAKEHRIDFNVLYDHNPQKYLDSVETFIDQLKSPTDINLFLISLTNENISHKLYSYQYPDSSNGKKFATKCDLVCDAVQKVLKSRDLERYFETLIATFCQRTNPALEEALMQIKEKRDAENNSNAQLIADKAMKFLLCLVDIGELYKIALGTYDFNLAVMVAEKSKMDPKEYLPFLNELQEMEENYRKYKIDMHLQRYKAALKNISKCEGRFSDCLALIIDQRLYTSALNLFPPASSCFKAVWTAYGDYLMSKLYYKEAGLVYWKSENYEKALKAYQESGDWQLALSTAHHLQYSREKIVLLAQSLALRLKERQKYEESALLLEQYAQEVEQSIATLIEGHVWDSAMNLIAKYGQSDLVATHFKPSLFEHHLQVLSSLNKMETDFCRYFERLKVVREKEECNESNAHHDYCSETTDDDASETSSVSNFSGPSQVSKTLSGSLATRKSSRNKKKTELKKYRLKEGSENEELALIVELRNIITNVDKSKDGFFSFLRTLVQFDFENEARELQRKMKQVVSVVEKAMPIIWCTQKTASEMNYGPDFTVNALFDITQRQMKTIKKLSDPALSSPPWQKSTDLFLQLLD